MTPKIRKNPFTRPRPVFVTCDAGLTDLLTAELHDLGFDDVFPAHRGVGVQATREQMWRINLESRFAHRVLLPLTEFPVHDEEQLYKGIRRIDWSKWMRNMQTLAIDSSEVDSAFDNTMYINQRTKDAICDYFTEETGRRPSVDRKHPDIRVNVRIDGERCLVCLDSSGERLYRRGYRRESGEAPLRETLAAALVKLAGWTPDKPLIDPLCGSGTILIEAALIARDIAPGLVRLRNGIDYGFMRWVGHDRARFELLVQELRDRIKEEVEVWPLEEAPKAEAPEEAAEVEEEAEAAEVEEEAEAAEVEEEAEAPSPTAGWVVGLDVDAQVLSVAERNARRAGVTLDLRLGDVLDARPFHPEGFIISNPPYGHRLKPATLRRLYEELAGHLNASFKTHTALFLVAEDAPDLGFDPELRWAVSNGPIPCEVMRVPLPSKIRGGRAPRGGDRPFRRRDDRPRQEGGRPFKARDERDDHRDDRGDRPYKRRDDRGGRPERGDRPFKRRDDRDDRAARGGDRPFKRRDDRGDRGDARGDRPFKHRDDRGDRPNRGGGDRPFKRRDDRGDDRGDRPFKRRDDRGDHRDDRGDRPFKRRDDRGDRPNRGGDRPFKRRDDRDDRPNRGGDRPYKRRDDRDDRRDDRPRGDRPYKRRDDRDDRPNRGGDRPFKRRDDRGDRGDRPNRGGDRPFKRPDEPREDRPFKRSARFDPQIKRWDRREEDSGERGDKREQRKPRRKGHRPSKNKP